MNDEVHIASFILSMRPEYLRANLHALRAMPFVEITHIDPCGKLIAVIEAENHAAIAEFIDAAQRLTGIAAVNFVHHETHSAAALAETII